jgi:UDP-GlcNAc:undecaprenyl-phosphate GlcNAc-1-phosphate transferase
MRVADVVPPKRLDPRWGGIAITLGTVIPSAAVLGLADLRITAILLAATAVAALGLIGDMTTLPVLARLTVQSLAAGGVVLSGVQVTLTGHWPDGPVTVMWIVGVANCFSLLNSTDRLLPAVATITAVFLAGTALILAEPAVAVLLATMACASLGLLGARTPMGGSGSLFIGFVLTCSAILLIAGRSQDTIAAGLLLPALVAIADTGFAFAGTGQISERLHRGGLDSRAVTGTYGAAAAAAGLLCLLVAMGLLAPLTAAAAGTALVAVGAFQCRPRRVTIRPAPVQSSPLICAGAVPRQARDPHRWDGEGLR